MEFKIRDKSIQFRVEISATICFGTNNGEFDETDTAIGVNIYSGRILVCVMAFVSPFLNWSRFYLAVRCEASSRKTKKGKRTDFAQMEKN